MNTNTVIITMPMRDGDPTSVTYQWADKAVKMARGYGYRVIDVRKKDVTYDNVSQLMAEYKPRIFIHMGHGCSTSLQGQTECIVTRRFGVDELLSMPNFREIILPLTYKTGCLYTCKALDDPCSPLCMNETNINLFKGTMMVAVACYSGEQLGRCAVKYGADSYFGYDDLFLFPVDESKSEDLFGRVQLVYIKAILEGRTAAEAEKITSNYEDILIKKYKKVKYLSLPLLWNKIHRQIHGNKMVTIHG